MTGAHQLKPVDTASTSDFQTPTDVSTSIISAHTSFNSEPKDNVTQLSYITLMIMMHHSNKLTTVIMIMMHQESHAVQLSQT